MKARRGSGLWGETDGLASMVYRFEPGDLVIPVADNQSDFLGVVKEVLPKINKVMVLWGGGSLKQHDPDEILLHPHQDPIVRSRMGSARRMKADSTVSPVPHGDQFVGNPETHGIDAPRGGGFSIMQDLQKDLHKEMKKESEVQDNPRVATRRGSSFFADKGSVAADASRVAMEFPTQDAMDKYLKEHPDADKSLHTVKETKKEEKSQPGSLLYKWQEGHKDAQNALRDIKSKHGNSARLWKNELGEIDKLLKNSLETGKSNKKGIGEQLDKMHTKMGSPGGRPEIYNKLLDAIDSAHNNAIAIWLEKNRKEKTSSLKSRRAMYWGAPDRVYRLTREEQQNGSAICPKCHKEMALEPFTKSEKLYTCPKCGFKVPTSKTTTTRITIDVDKDGEVGVDVTTAKGKKTRRGSLKGLEAQ